jgi:hypothetical protein
MNINTGRDLDEAQQILDALHEIQDNPELRSEAQRNLPAALDRLGVSGVARHAVAFGVAGLLVAPALLKPDAFWA